jgi:hypothetical protein
MQTEKNNVYYKVMMIRFITFILIILFFICPLKAEVLSLPPLTYEQPFIENEPFPVCYGWFDFRHHAPANHTPSNAEIAPAWILDSGLIFTLYSWKYAAIEWSSRHIFLNRLDPEHYLLFWPLSIFSDLRLSVAFKIMEFTSRIFLQHDCKHDIETNFGRVVIHESFNLEVTRGPFILDWPQSPFSTLIKAGALLRFNFTPVFQNQDIREPDIFCLTLKAEADPVMIESAYALFFQTECNLLFRDTKSDVTLASGFTIDWSVKAGIRLFKRNRGLAVYTELESLSDDWITDAPESKLLFSYGFLFYYQ